MSSTAKGNKLEDTFFEYLCAQKDRGALVFGAYPPELCRIFKKKDYYCRERQGDVNFDVVIEVFREGGQDPHLFVIFECKNHRSPIQERDITDASDKIGRIFKHAAKGVVVGSIGLQKGAANIAKSRKMGIVKFDDNGLDVVADRRGRTWTEPDYLEAQIHRDVKPLKFSAYFDGKYFGSVSHFIGSLAPMLDDHAEPGAPRNENLIPFVTDIELDDSANGVLEKIEYKDGKVDLLKICQASGVTLTFSEQAIHGLDGTSILGSANFGTRSITINLHENKNRERFTIAHEIGHFTLGHEKYLLSETVAENDLLVDETNGLNFHYERLEHQANFFASSLLLPKERLLVLVESWRRSESIVDKGHGHIFVDDQPCNFLPYGQLLSELSEHFAVSKQAIAIRLSKLGLVNDVRTKHKNFSSFLGRA